MILFQIITLTAICYIITYPIVKFYENTKKLMEDQEHEESNNQRDC